MTTISLTLPADGTTIDASDVNAPFNQIATVINGGIDSTNITDGGVTPNELVGGTGSSWAWTSFTPAWTNLTVGNGTNTGKYCQIGKTVFVRVTLVLGTTSAVSTGPILTLPLTSSSAYNTLVDILGIAYLQANYGAVRWVSTTTVDPIVWNAAATYVVANGVTAAVPVAWGSGNVITMHFKYEAA